MTDYRYASLKFAGPPWKSAIKRAYWNLLRRPHRARLGAGSYIVKPFACNAPGHMTIGDQVMIGAGANFQLLTSFSGTAYSPRLEIGSEAYIGSRCEIVCIDAVRIGCSCTLSDGVYINDCSHSMDPRQGHIMDRPLTTKGPVTIGDHCFIGRGATVLSGVTLGEHCVVGTGAVVTRSAPAWTMLAGNPARVVARFDMAAGRWVAGGRPDPEAKP
jgi:acetyltransferase-like isoleucine patch superfamily enzyme